MALALSNFLLSLVAAVAGIASADGGGALEAARDLWAGVADENNTADPYGVLRIYGGPPPEEMSRVRDASIQCMVWGLKEWQALDLCSRFYEALYDENNFPRHRWRIAGKRINETSNEIEDDPDTDWNIRLVALREPPGVITRDTETGASQAVFNFDARFEPVAKAA